MKKIFITTFILSILLSGCTYYAYQYQTGSTALTETSPESIKIYSGDIEQAYTVIGSVAVDVPGDADKAAKFLKNKASELGADVIINADLTKMNSFSQRTGISGVAVKLK